MTSMRVNRRLEELSGFHLGLLRYFLQKGRKRVQNGSVFPQNCIAKNEMNQNAEVKTLTVASRRHNPSSISDSKGGVYKRMPFFPPHPQRICGMIPASDLGNNIFDHIFCVCMLFGFDLVLHSPAGSSSCDACAHVLC